MVKEATKEHRTSRWTNRAHAKEMRLKPVATEKSFWSLVRNRQLGGFKFKRQVPVGPYIADFVCLERRLVVELDGAQHADRKDYDAARDAYMRREGFRVFRFTNEDFAGDTAIVLRAIEHALGPPHPDPLPRRGEGTPNCLGCNPAP